ncbi:MAG: tRNA pseudouridine(13) synthase TruD [Planctomycetota bacterium]|nr:tRNA pseudouridine(13) synthase TruD [Planctomycetota bacterium]
MSVALVPLVTARLPGTGGVVKRDSADFVVTEIPLYEPSGLGEHVYVRHRRANRTTREVVAELARAFRVDERDIGYAGLKDRRAIATQTFSLPLREPDLSIVAERLASEVCGETLEVKRHANKLKRGHSLGNRFEIRLHDTDSQSLPRALAIASELGVRGLPNAFGPQRYGDDGRNAEHGRALIERPRGGWLARLHMSAWQSSLFDSWLALRMERGLFESVVAGDVAKKFANGALFDVVDEGAENARVASLEITHTGPMFGSEMRAATGVAGELEDTVFAASGVRLEQLRKAQLQGTRRAGRIFVDDIAIDSIENGLLVSFRLPKGSYATTVLREFTKNECALADEED